MRITNKEKQYYGGNWGKPTDHGKVTNKIPDDVDDEQVRIKSKRKKKQKKVFKLGTEDCPFCNKELAVDEIELKKQEQEISIWSFDRFMGRKPRVKFCECGAKEVKDCPSCHRATWYKDLIYKHMPWGSWCTFEGKRKKENRQLE